jgi:hypothetical protein
MPKIILEKKRYLILRVLMSGDISTEVLIQARRGPCKDERIPFQKTHKTTKNTTNFTHLPSTLTILDPTNPIKPIALTPTASRCTHMTTNYMK